MVHYDETGKAALVTGGERGIGRWTQCIYSLSTEIKKMQLYQGISPHSL